MDFSNMTDDRKRQQVRVRKQTYRERGRPYGKPWVGYCVTRCVIPSDVLDILAQRYGAIAAARASRDAEELGRVIDAFLAAIAYGELSAFEEDYALGNAVPGVRSGAAMFLP